MFVYPLHFFPQGLGPGCFPGESSLTELWLNWLIGSECWRTFFSVWPGLLVPNVDGISSVFDQGHWFLMLMEFNSNKINKRPLWCTRPVNKLKSSRQVQQHTTVINRIHHSTQAGTPLHTHSPAHTHAQYIHREETMPEWWGQKIIYIKNLKEMCLYYFRVCMRIRIVQIVRKIIPHRGTVLWNWSLTQCFRLEWGILGVHVSAEEQRSLEEAYRPGCLWRCCGPVPVISLKQILETLTFILCLHLIGNQSSDCKMGLVGGWALWTSHAAAFWTFCSLLVRC